MYRTAKRNSTILQLILQSFQIQEHFYSLHQMIIFRRDKCLKSMKSLKFHIFKFHVQGNCGFSRAVWEWQIDTQSNRNCYIIVHTKEKKPQGNAGLSKVGHYRTFKHHFTCVHMYIHTVQSGFQLPHANLCAKSLSQPQIHPVAIPQLQKANQPRDSKTKYKNRNSRALTSSTFPCLRIFLIKPLARSLCQQFSFLNLLWYCLLDSKAIFWLFWFSLVWLEVFRFCLFGGCGFVLFVVLFVWGFFGL